MANKFTTIDQLRQLAVRCLAAINGKVEEVAQDAADAISGLTTRFNQHIGNHAPADAEKNVQSDWSVTDTSSDAFIKNKPTIPAAYSHPETHPAGMITGLSTVATSGSYNDLTNKPTIPAAYTHPGTHPASMITGLADVATSGSYNDLINKPTIPAAYTHPTSHPASMITGLADVATSGSYNDLSNKPTIPTVNNGTLTIQKNGTSVATFTANQSGNATANITVPTKVSDLTNDKGYLTSETDPNVPSWAKQPNKPTYTASEVGARPSTWTPTAADVGARPNTWTPTAADVGASPTGHKHTKSDITDFPSAMPPTAHTHKKSEITDFSHTHSKSEITDFPTSMPPTAHNHDDRYYTESEMDTKLAGKAPAYTCGTADLTAGTSALATGTLYFVYE